MATEERRLTDKQQRFIEAYLGEARMNASAAARIAGYAVRQSGWEILSNPVIRARIDERLLAESMSGAEVLHELTDVARAEWRDFIEVRADQYGRKVIARMDLGSKVKALELIGKAHKLFTDKMELGHDPDNPPLIRVIYDDHRPAPAEAAPGPGAGD